MKQSFFNNKFVRTVIPHVPGHLFLWGFVLASSREINGKLHFTLWDDAMISMTYGRTLAQSGEFLWFSGADKVQGFTNMLWTLYMALLHFLGLTGSGAALAISITGVIIITLLALVSKAIIAGKSQDRRVVFISNVCATSVYFLFPLTFWTLRGMEVGLLALLFMSIVYLLQSEPERNNRFSKKSWLLVMLVSAGVATRIDFIVPMAALALGLAINRFEPGGEAIRKTLARSGLIMLAGTMTLAVILVIQMWVWGDMFPNTYFLKVEGFALQERILRGVFSSLKFFPLAILGFVSWWQIQKNSNVETRQLSTLLFSGVVASLAYSIYVGGDAWEGLQMSNRYLAAALVPILVLCVLAVREMDFTSKGISFRRRFLVITGLSSFLLGASVNPFAYKPVYAIAGILSLSALAVGYRLLEKPARQNSRNRHLQGVVATLLVLVFSSAIPVSSMLAWRTVQAAGVDAQMTSLGIALKEATKPGAKIALAWAGAPAYYSERQTIDLLGKNDKRIAHQTPVFIEGSWNSEFYPGHNKFDFDYSVGILKPDIMAQLLGVPGEATKLAALGYEKKCLADAFEVYVLQKSPNLNPNVLVTCK
jgi:arabinofuranosyltransferase